MEQQLVSGLPMFTNLGGCFVMVRLKTFLLIDALLDLVKRPLVLSIIEGAEKREQSVCSRGWHKATLSSSDS